MSAEPPVVLHCVLSVATGGLEVMLLHLASATDRTRFTPRVVCLQARGELTERFESAGIPVDLIDRPASGGRSTLQSLIRYLRASPPSIIHTHNRGPHQHGAFARLATGIPAHIHTRHDRTSATTWKTRLIERTATRLTDRIVPVSRDAELVARTQDGARSAQLRMITNGVDVARFATRTSRENSYRAVHVARLDPVKDQEGLLRAAAIVSAAEPRFRLDLVGDGPCRAALEALTDSLGLRQAVTFHGMQRDVRPFLETADLFVLSSLSEGLAMTLLEAMAAGLPVVATDVGGNREAVVDGQTGTLVPAANPEAMAQAILQTMHTREAREQQGRAGRERVLEHFALDTMVSGYQQLYDDLLAARSKARQRRFAA